MDEEAERGVKKDMMSVGMRKRHNAAFNAERSNFICTNKQHYLVRDSVATCWPFGRHYAPFRMIFPLTDAQSFGFITFYLDLAFTLSGLGEIIGKLHPHKVLHLRAECLFNA